VPELPEVETVATALEQLWTQELAAVEAAVREQLAR